jgi:hypothetical protein
VTPLDALMLIPSSDVVSQDVPHFDHGVTTDQPGRPSSAPASRLPWVPGFLRAHVLIRQCAWCGRHMGFRWAWKHGAITHGLCPPCLAGLKAAMDEQSRRIHLAVHELGEVLLDAVGKRPTEKRRH